VTERSVVVGAAAAVAVDDASVRFRLFATSASTPMTQSTATMIGVVRLAFGGDAGFPQRGHALAAGLTTFPHARHWKSA
jgi:hypothetical protein